MQKKTKLDFTHFGKLIQFGDYIREIVINGDFETKEEQELYDEYDKILTEDYPMPSQSVDYTLFIADKEINI